MMFFLLFYIISSYTWRKFPFYPVYKSNCLGTLAKKCIIDFFSFCTINESSSSYPVFQKCISAFQNNNTSDCLNNLHSLAIENNGDAAFTLGTIHELGLFGNQQNDTLARYYYLLGANAGHADSQYSLSFMQRYGFGGAKDVEESLINLKSAVLGNSIPAILADSFRHIYGLNYPKSYHTAFNNLRPIMKIILLNLTVNRMEDKFGVKKLTNKSINKQKDYVASFKLLRHDLGKTKFVDKWEFKLYAHLMLFGDHTGLIEPNYTAAKIMAKNYKGIYNDFMERYILGNIYHYGLGAHVNLTLAEELYQMCVFREDPHCLYADFQLYNFKYIRERFLGKCWVPMKKRINGFPKEVHHKATNICQTLDAEYYKGIFLYQGTFQHSNPKLGLWHIFRVAEYSPLFDMAKLAWVSYVNGDMNYSLRLYQKIADWGSGNAFYNVCIILDALKQDKSDWYNTLLFIKHSGTLFEKSIMERAAGNETERLRLLKKIKNHKLHAKYQYVVSTHQSQRAKSLDELNYILKSKEHTVLAVWIHKLKIFIEAFPIGIIHVLQEKNTFESKVFLCALIILCVIANLMILVNYGLKKYMNIKPELPSDV